MSRWFAWVASVGALVSVTTSAAACDCVPIGDTEAASLATFREASIVAVGRLVKPVRLPPANDRTVAHAEYRLEQSWKGPPAGTTVVVDFTMSFDPSASCGNSAPREREILLYSASKPGHYALSAGCGSDPDQALLDRVADERRRKEAGAAGGDPEALHELGRFYRYYGMRSEALDLYKRLVDKDPDDQFAVRALGEAYLAMGKVTEAAGAVARVHGRTPKDGKSAILSPYINDLMSRAGERRTPGLRPRTTMIRLGGLDFATTEFLALKLDALDLSDGTFERTTWEDVSFSYVRIDHSKMNGNRFDNAHFSSTRLHDVDLRASIFARSVTGDLEIEDSTLTNVRLGDWKGGYLPPLRLKLTNVRLRDVKFSGVSVAGDFRGAPLENVVFDHVDLDADCAAPI